MKSIIAIFFLFLFSVNCGEDYYKILQVSREANEREMKRSHRKLSLKYHPDKNPGNKNAHEMFLLVNKAYEVLSDPEKRKIYDIYGEEGLNQQNLMGQEDKPRGHNARVEIAVELEDLYNGAVKELSLQKNVVCNKCHGTGGKLGKTKQCHMCKGRGVVMQDVNTGMGFSLKMQNTCPQCKGKGITFSETCPHCRGRKVVKEDKVLQVIIEKGMRDNENIVFPRESEQSPDTIPGDLIVILKQNKHKFFHSRRENDLFADIELNLKEALLGFSKKITHLDRREFYVDSAKTTQPFEVRNIKGEGMPFHNFSSQKGNLHINFRVRLPERLNNAEKELVKQLFSD